MLFGLFNLKNITNSPDKKNKDYLKRLITNLEHVENEDKTIPFYIQTVREKGLSVKIGGLFAYVPFSLMPWKSPLKDYWKTISPHIIGKKFFGKVHELNTDPNIKIIINGKVHLFKEPEFPTFSFTFLCERIQYHFISTYQYTNMWI